MTKEQADQIIDYMFGMLRPPDPVETRKSWGMQLLPLDAEVASRAAINGMEFWQFFPSWPLFYGEYRSLMRAARPREQVSCNTCGGDRFVLVALRTPETTDWMNRHGFKAKEDQPIEELAPCPDCNPTANTSFRRHDGMEVTCPDPARVRQMMSG